MREAIAVYHAQVRQARRKPERLLAMVGRYRSGHADGATRYKAPRRRGDRLEARARSDPAAMIAVDAGVFLALADRSDAWHESASGRRRRRRWPRWRR